MIIICMSHDQGMFCLWSLLWEGGGGPGPEWGLSRFRGQTHTRDCNVHGCTWVERILQCSLNNIVQQRVSMQFWSQWTHHWRYFHCWLVVLSGLSWIQICCTQDTKITMSRSPNRSQTECKVTLYWCSGAEIPVSCAGERGGVSRKLPTY